MKFKTDFVTNSSSMGIFLICNEMLDSIEKVKKYIPDTIYNNLEMDHKYSIDDIRNFIFKEIKSEGEVFSFIDRIANPKEKLKNILDKGGYESLNFLYDKDELKKDSDIKAEKILQKYKNELFIYELAFSDKYSGVEQQIHNNINEIFELFETIIINQH